MVNNINLDYLAHDFYIPGSYAMVEPARAPVFAWRQDCVVGEYNEPAHPPVVCLGWLGEATYDITDPGDEDNDPIPIVIGGEG